jgi:hypothetical protein
MIVVVATYAATLVCAPEAHVGVARVNDAVAVAVEEVHVLRNAGDARALCK